LLLAKSWNMWSSWHEHYIAGARPHYLGIIVRFCLNAAWVYLALADASVLFLLSIWLIMGLLSVYFMRTTKGKPLPWELLIRNEEKAKLAFYRLANVFTDVPYLKQRAKRRKWLDFGLVFISWHQRSAFDYLYARTFFRAGDYFGLYMRLTALGCLFMYMIPFNYGKIGAALLFLYATHLQLLTFVHHHRSQLFVKLYPLPDGVQKQAAFRLLFILSLVQNALFSLFLAVLGDWKTAALLLGAGTMLSYWLLWIYFCRRGRIQA
jgi:ABC-2 type transport system permease protein